MKAVLLRSVLLASFMVPAASVLAADLDPPPELRPSDWTGVYVGVVGSVTSLDGHYDKYPDCPPGGGGGGCPPVDPEMSGTGYMGGFVAGFNWQWDSLLMGIEGDYQWGGEIADNVDPAELTDFSMNGMATIRARAGWVVDDSALIYVTGGLAMVDTEFGGEVGPLGASDYSSDRAWVYGWTVGGGMEYAFSEWIHGRIEYLYTALEDQRYRLEDSNGFGGDVEMHFNGIHQIRAGLTYNFSL